MNKEKTQLFSAALCELLMISAISLLSVPRSSSIASSNALDIFELSKSSPRPYAVAYPASEASFCLLGKWELTACCTHWAFKKALNQVVSMTPPPWLLCFCLFSVLFRHSKMNIQKPAAGPKSHMYSAMWVE